MATPPPPALRVLLVEDDEEHAALTQRVLQRRYLSQAFDVRHARSAQAAIAMRDGSHDVILLDLHLPDGSGLDVLVRLLRAFKGVPLVVLTSNSDEELAMNAVQAGAQDYLRKDRLDGGNLSRALVFAVERRRAQELLGRHEQQLADAQAIAHLGSWDNDLIAGAVTWSAELYRLYGLEPGTVEPSLETFLTRVVHPDDRARVAEYWREARVTYQTPSHEHRILRGNGEVRTLFSRSSFFFDADGRPIRLAGTFLDITDRKQLEAHVVVAGRLAATGTLATGVAHEINNPLAGVLGNIDFVSDVLRRRDGAEMEDCRSALADAREAALRVARIVRELKELSRVDEGTRGKLQVNAVLESALTVASNQVKHRARVVRDYGVTPDVDAVEGRLLQVFVHLLVNAAQAVSDRANESSVIGLKTYTDDASRVVVEVRDNGVGISPAHLEHIFDPFFTTRPIGTAMGLGLTSAHAIVAAIGGMIAVDSTEGHGSVFRVTLPAAKSSLARPSEPRPRLTPGVRPRILVIDDEELIVKILERILARHYEVEVETDSQSALGRLLRGELFDLVLCDLMMPRLSGMQLFREVESRLPAMKERMVFLSGGAFTQDARDFLASVPNPTFEKPFEPARLLAQVRGLLMPRASEIR